MARVDPPKLAAWTLENLIPASERDEALAGDLAESLCAGRSDAWYWQQTAAAIGTSWWQYLSRRRAMLVFALLWSMLAPAWYVTINGIEDSHDLWNKAWPLAFLTWAALSAAFLWAGLMVYQLVHRFLGTPIPRNQIRRAFWTVPIVLPPLYGIAFVFTSLYRYSVPGLVHAKLAASVFGQVADFGIYADIIRLPYFLALLVALWGTAQHLQRGAGPLLIDGAQTGSVAEPFVASQSPRTTVRFFAFVIAAGVMNALLFAFLLCRLPVSNSPGLLPLLIRAVLYMALGGLAGAMGAWIYWNHPASPFRDSAPINFRVFALAGAAGWIWMPALIIFFEQVTAVTAIVAAIAAFSTATCLRRVPLDLEPELRDDIARQHFEDAELFSVPMLRPRPEGSGMLISVAIYAAGFAIAARSFLGASALLGLAAFLLGWRRTVQRREPRPHETGLSVFRLAILGVPAALVTAWALMTGVAHRAQVALAATTASSGQPSAQQKGAGNSPVHGFGGYDSVILWPFPEKKQIIAPLPDQASILAPGTTRPFTIRFDGPYWYLQPPDQRPESNAHNAHGSPLGVHIEALNSLPLVMEARQRLGESVPLARCGQVDVELENRDDRLGVVAVVLLLEDSSSKGHPQLDAGRQQLVTGESETSGVQSFHFSLPSRGPIRRFDNIAVLFLPESGHGRVGPRIAVRELRLYPR